MSLNTYLGIGAFIALVLIIVAVTRKKKPASPSSEPALAVEVPAPPVTPQTSAPTETPTWNQGGFEVSENAEPLTPQPLPTTGVEVWNQTNFHVFVTQQGIRATLAPQGRMRLENGKGLTVSPSAQNTLQSVALEQTDPETPALYTLIVR
ncbi:hypothetical protein [Pseudomonas sp. L1(2025)]|uniref:hypothetical protein n=1 Tax=Pseudomonas sp. L1(2025) TaxID=3449429 RepID=UPI003F694455